MLKNDDIFWIWALLFVDKDHKWKWKKLGMYFKKTNFHKFEHFSLATLIIKKIKTIGQASTKSSLSFIAILILVAP